jgi:hypothetical protein
VHGEEQKNDRQSAAVAPGECSDPNHDVPPEV